jgi:8-oxo-dGTP pyrophosphatase MutT (NUDIX family)
MAIQKYVAPDLGPRVPKSRMNQAAGAFVCAANTGRFLLQLRGPDGDAAGMWGQFGGGIESGETREAAVQRELEEETGYSGPIFMRALKPNVDAHFTYHNFAAVVPQEFEPVTNGETAGHVWCEFGQWPTPLHPGILRTFRDPASMAILRDTCNQRDYHVQFCKRYGRTHIQDWNQNIKVRI